MSPCRRWMSPVIAGLLVGGAGAIAAGPASAASPKTCNQLKGKSAVKSPTIRVGYVTKKTANDNVRIFYGCVKPKGEVFELGRKGQVGNYDYEYGISFGSTAGRYLIVRTSSNEGGPAGTTEHETFVHDLKSGAERSLGGYSALGTGEEDEFDGGYCSSRRPTRYVLSSAGVVAGLYRVPSRCESSTNPDVEDDKSTNAAIEVSIPGRSKRTVLDIGYAKDLPQAGLGLRGRTVTWTKAGEKRSKTV